MLVDYYPTFMAGISDTPERAYEALLYISLPRCGHTEARLLCRGLSGSYQQANNPSLGVIRYFNVIDLYVLLLILYLPLMIFIYGQI